MCTTTYCPAGIIESADDSYSVGSQRCVKAVVVIGVQLAIDVAPYDSRHRCIVACGEEGVIRRCDDIGVDHLMIRATRDPPPSGSAVGCRRSGDVKLYVG